MGPVPPSHSYGTERALTFSYVRQLPRHTLHEVHSQDAVYDRQVLLNELWPRYCERSGQPDNIPQEPQRDKWVTETWDEWAVRKRSQPENIEAFLRNLGEAQEAEKHHKHERAARTQRVLDDIEKAEAERRKHLLPVLHTLQLDFEQQQAAEHARRRQEFTEREAAARAAIEEESNAAFNVLSQLDAEGRDHIAYLLEQRRLAEEEAERARQADLQRREEERLAEELRLAEAEKRKEQERQDAEKKREQEEKDRRAAERKARIGAERDKRKNKEEEAAQRRDSRRRSSGRSSAETKQLRRDAARQSRLQRQAGDMEAYLKALPPRVAACSSEADLEALLGAVSSELGLLLFDCAVYIPVVAGGSLAYRHTSANCSTLLRANKEAFEVGDHPACPTVVAMRDKKSAHLSKPFMDDARKGDMVRVGTKETTGGDGDFFTTPIYGASGEVSAMLSADTMNELNVRQTNLLENEQDCYESDGAVPPVPITSEMAKFLEAVARLLSDAVVMGTIPDVSSSSSLSELYASVTRAVASFGPGICCYIATLTYPESEALTVVSQNGFNLGSPDAPVTFPPHANVLSKNILRPSGSPSFSITPGEVKQIPNVAEDGSVLSYAGDAKRADYLLILPIETKKPGGGMQVMGVVGVEGLASSPLTEGQISQIKSLVAQLCERRDPLAKERALRLYASQCVQWCSALSGCNNVYLSFKQSAIKAGGDDAVFEYVAATPAQQFVVGKTIPKGSGVTPSVIASGGGKHFIKVAEAEGLHLVDPAKKKDGLEGQLTMAPIGSIGAIYLDTVGWTEGKKNLTEADLNMLASAGAHLAGLSAELDEVVDISVPEGEPTLMIEKDVNPSCVRFLKKIYMESAAALSNMKKQDLLEMAKYNKPPEAVPPVCSATFIVLGKKPKVVSTWDKTRKLIKYPVLAKMAKFDPTGTKPAKAFFIRAKKLTKGFTVDVVAKKGSVPTSLFFNWTYVNIQLRYAAVRFRKQHAAGLLEVGALPSALDDTTETDVGSSIDAATEGDEDLEADGDDGDAGEADGDAEEGDAAEGGDE